MKRLCDHCIHCYKPESIKDFFDKTMKMPNMHKWGVDVFKHLFWLCNCDEVSKRIHTNDSMLMEQCIEQNIDGNCEYFKTSNAEDIIPSLVSIEEPTEKIREGDEASLEVTITPATIPAVTEEKITYVEEPLKNENGGLVLDENGQPQYVSVPKTETVVIVPEHENDQDITYKYQWYRNGRKLFKETKSTIKLDTTVASEDVYKCEVSQYITNNGDGGVKTVVVSTNEITISVIGVNKIVLHLTAGTDPTKIDLPFTPSIINIPYSLPKGWVITDIKATDKAILTEKIIDKVTIECSEGIEAEFYEGIEISGSSGIVTFKWDAE